MFNHTDNDFNQTFNVQMINHSSNINYVIEEFIFEIVIEVEVIYAWNQVMSYFKDHQVAIVKTENVNWEGNKDNYHAEIRIIE